jgi:hypothetical protein
MFGMSAPKSFIFKKGARKKKKKKMEIKYDPPPIFSM